MRRWIVFVVALALTMVSLGSVAEAQQDLTFYVIAHTGPGDPFWAVVQKGVEDAADQLGVRAVFQGPPQRNVPQQVNMFESALRGGADGIAVTISDPRAWVDPVTRARAANVPVVAINVQEPADFPDEIPYMAYIGMDEYTAGRNLAAFMAPKLSNGALVVIANHEPGHSGLEQRSAGITDELTGSLGARVERLNITQNPTQAISVLRSFMQANPDTEAIFTLGPLGTIPTVRFLQDTGRAGEVKVASFDLDEVTVNAIRNGIVEATVDQQPYLQGYMAVVQLYLNVRYAFQPTRYDTGTGLVTAENVDQVARLVSEGYR